MSKRPPQETSELVATALALEEELRRFESLADEVRDSPMRSQKHLERLARTLTQVADCDERLVAHMRSLLTLLNGWKARQQALATEVNGRALVLQERTRVYQELMERFGSLGREAGALSARVQEIFAGTSQGKSVQVEEVITALQGVNERMTEVAESAGQLASEAQEQDFTDVARDAESLRQQLLAARDKAGLLQKKLHPGVA
jgi:DNA repair exonuclease SbcCD ATPase subunit